ncbi:aminopeptidase (plasmid) [Legionella adelaidensis]|uniref:Aminopeptidase N n=1 Tax=Legionella adelaidensis TaxID=45056 RepID=A0A0W0R0W7_9GAMM|nr:aminopeptidase N [Legionella adelaidensis]KTC64585.1 aminopeptidase [Legionella adelaidensis]VEH85953.1 aminopeptidase [Legionella adelaidensis]
MSNVTIYRNDYQPPNFIVNNIHLNFDLFDDHALVKSELSFTRQHPGPLCLYGDELELVNIEMNNEKLDERAYRLENDNLLLTECPEHFSLTITTRIRPQENTKLSGLYRSDDMFCTQCEAEGFRRITFFPDRPDVLTSFTTRITADKKKYPVLLSNGNLIESGELEEGRHWVIWQDPFKKPSYLFALVAGDLACVRDEYTTMSGRTVDIRIYVEPGNEDKCDHAMASVKNAMRWDEESFGREYDLDIFMIVAVSNFNMGAMENKGLNIFNSKYILARPDTATDQDYIDIEGVVGHEYFHNWTGDRVTCRDWFQLSLKEGLTVFRDQEFSRDMNSRDVFRIADVRVLRNSQFPEDAGAMAHPVRPDSYQEINNFYTATIYNKGAEVIRMQQTILGKEGFRKGMDLYFERHDGQAVTIDDFVAAMEDANNVDFTQFKRWYSQAGTPEVTVIEEFANNKLTLTLEQHCRPTADSKEKLPFHIPLRIALYTNQGESITLKQELIELKEKKQIFTFENIAEKPIISLLRDFSAPITLHFKQSQEDLIRLLRFESNGYAKWDAAQRLTLNCLTHFYNTNEEEWELPESLINTYAHVLRDEGLDYALRAELITLPSYEDVASCLEEVDVIKVEKARDFFRSQLGSALFESAHQLYEKLWQAEDHLMNNKAYGRRKLRNMCLWFMMKADEERAISLCQTQFAQAKTMTDQIAGVGLIANSHSEVPRKSALAQFYQQWQNEDLVIEKWFGIQATSELPHTLERVKELLNHKDFTFKNPNKVRAVIASFCQANPRNFHAEDGSGYAFLTQMLVKIDALNPQIAARLATPFTRWQKLNKERQALIKKELNYLYGCDLSKDLRELVSKSLEA